MAEKLQEGYEQLEKEIIELSVNRFMSNESGNNQFEEQFDFQDPRVVASIAGAESAGFSMREGQYIDLI